MQSFNACKKRLSEIQRFSSTRMRCITAIWPAGPPKLSIATRSQTRNASRSDTPCRGTDSPPSAIASSATPGLLHGRGRPVVRFRLESATPGVERVVHHHAVPKHFVIVRKVRGQAERDGEQAAALRGQIVSGRVGASDDLGQMVESRILDAVDAQDGVERAALSLVGELDPVDVVGRSARLFSDLEHVLGRDVNELRLRIDETSDQPWTGDAVDLWVLSGHPLARCSPDRPVCRKTIVDPFGDPALQVTCINARGA